jgi:hypothetical protein
VKYGLEPPSQLAEAGLTEADAQGAQPLELGPRLRSSTPGSAAESA